MKMNWNRWIFCMCAMMACLLCIPPAAFAEGDGDGSVFSSPAFLDYRAIEAVDTEDRTITIGDTEYPMSIDMVCYNTSGEVVDVSEMKPGTLVRFSLTAEGEVNTVWEKNPD